jgi:transaldolase
MPVDVLGQLSGAGVSVWLDDISRDRLRTGNLQQLIDDCHVVGVTSNPTIFAHAVDDGHAYDAQLADLKARGALVEEASRAITTYDIRWASDVLRPVHDATAGLDGRVSIEVDPRAAKDTRKTIAEARNLWWMVDRPNLFIKPAPLATFPNAHSHASARVPKASGAANTALTRRIRPVVRYGLGDGLSWEHRGRRRPGAQMPPSG